MTIKKDHEGYEYPLYDKDRRGLDTISQKRHYDDFYGGSIIPSKRRELTNINDQLKKYPTAVTGSGNNIQFDHLISERDRLTNELSEYTTTEVLYNAQQETKREDQEQTTTGEQAECLQETEADTNKYAHLKRIAE